MWRCLVVVATAAFLWIPRVGGSFTSGFPSLDAVIGNASLLDRFTTLDGESRFVLISVNCSGRFNITKITFIALPGDGNENTTLTFIGTNSGRLVLDQANKAFGKFGYEIVLEPNIIFSLSGIGSLWIRYASGSDLRLLHKVGGDEGSDYEYDDYPLLAIDTEPSGCIDGLLSADELRRVWENRTTPVIYSSPYREIPLDCSGPVDLTRIVAGGHRLTDGGLAPSIRIDNRLIFCNLSPFLDDTTNVYECMVTNSPFEVGDDAFLRINQRFAGFKVVFLHNGTTDTPLISIDGNCSSSGLLSEDALREKASLYIPFFQYLNGDRVIFPDLNIRQAGYLVKWTFAAEYLGTGEEYPRLLVYGERDGNFQLLPIEQCSHPTLTFYPNVYECIIEPPFQVQTGDIIDLDLPSTQSAQLLLGILHNYGSVGGDSILPGSGDLIEGLPLITLKILPLGSVLPSTVSSTLSPTSVLPINPPTTAQPPPTSPTITDPTTDPTTEQPQPTSPTITDPNTEQPPPTSTTITDPTTAQPPATSPTITDPTTAQPPATSTTITDPTTEQPPPTSTTITDPNSERPVPSSSDSPTASTDTTDQGSSSDSTGAVVGAVMGLLVAIILVAVVALLLVLVLRRKKERVGIKEGDAVVLSNISSSHVPMDNPVYSGRASEPGRQEPEYQAPPPPCTTSTAATTTSGSQVYEVLDNVAGGGRKLEQNFDNPAYYSTLQDVHGTTDMLERASGTAMLSLNHYEMGIYVPTQTQASHEGKTLSFFEECDTYWRPASTREDLYQQLSQRKYREIPRHQIQITDHLGSGQFGTVNHGVWQVGGQGRVEVAVKMLQEGTAEEDAVRFLQEAAINGQFRHPNIVQLLGVVTMGKPVMIVLELLSNGDLRNYLLKHKYPPGELPLSDTAGLLSQFCLQVAEGMTYLSSKSFVHRDLAARNILITDDKKCKISDFGMSRDLDEGTYYVSHGGKVPIKWTAPEALHYKKYSTASDVWSFGCLVYEIWSLGHKPFEGYTNLDTIKLVDNGRRLAPPPGCPREMYRLMIACWNGDKSARPQFSEAVQTLSQSEHELLHIPEEVTRGHPQASVLGAPLDAGRSLYTELQNTYYMP